MRASPGRARAGALALALAFACAPTEPVAPTKGVARARAGEQKPPAADAQREYEEARAAADRDPVAGVDRLQVFIARWPQSGLVDPARLRVAQLERERGRTNAARAALSDLRVGGLSADERVAAFRLQAALAADAGDRAGEIVWLSKVRAAAPDADAEALVDVDLDERIAKLDPSSLERAASQLGDRVPAARVRLRQAELALARRDAEGALLALAQASRLPLTRDESAQLGDLERRTHAFEETGVLPPSARPSTLPSLAPLPTATGSEGVAEAGLLDAGALSGTIGVVLPLSGPLARFGEQSLQGVLLAAGIFRSEAGAPGAGGLRVIVRDSGGRSDAAAAAVAALATDPTVTAVVGPIGADEAEAAAGQAEVAGLPLLTLSLRETVTAQRTHVFRVGVTPRDEATALAEYAARTLHVQRFGILYPDDPYGRGMRDVFQQAVLARGGEITGTAGYRPGTRDFEKPIRELVAGKLPTPEAPAPPFDALFVPAGRDTALLVAPQLAFLKLAPLRLLGQHGWQHADLLKMAGAQVEGAVIAEPFDAGSQSPLVQEFVRRYQERMQGAPDVFAAQAFDATNLVLAELARGNGDRDSLREGLLHVREAPGVAGSTSMRADGNAEKRPTLVGVVSGQFVQLQGP